MRRSARVRTCPRLGCRGAGRTQGSQRIRTENNTSPQLFRIAQARCGVVYNSAWPEQRTAAGMTSFFDLCMYAKASANEHPFVALIAFLVAATVLLPPLAFAAFLGSPVLIPVALLLLVRSRCCLPFSLQITMSVFDWFADCSFVTCTPDLPSRNSFDRQVARMKTQQQVHCLCHFVVVLHVVLRHSHALARRLWP